MSRLGTIERCYEEKTCRRGTGFTTSEMCLEFEGNENGAADVIKEPVALGVRKTKC